MNPILHGGAVDLRDEAACAREPGAVEADALAEQPQFVGRLAGMLAATAADMDSQLSLQRAEPALQRADDAGRDARRVPVHAHHRAERLKPERVRQPLQEFVAAVMLHDRLCDDGAKRGHARRQPRRHASAVEREVGAAGASCHQVLASRELAQLYQLFASATVRNVMEYLGVSTAGMLCSQTWRDGPDIR